ncbi:unnamed protein product [Callosobruchus maculatus]|uniref:Uncharacterized protein n=1 Tax=Callosobruchus maculatus TaxID=64391 RepID=A0A653BZD6_CALMS|nr:unnamed protein product [Callosobruchus maculatus]
MVAFVHLPVPKLCLPVKLVSDESVYQNVQIHNHLLCSAGDLTSRPDSGSWHRNGSCSPQRHIISEPQPDLSSSRTSSSCPRSSGCPRTSHRPCSCSNRTCARCLWTRIWTALKTCRDYASLGEEQRVFVNNFLFYLFSLNTC